MKGNKEEHRGTLYLGPESEVEMNVGSSVLILKNIYKRKEPQSKYTLSFANVKHPIGKQS